MAFELEALPYAADALEPHIDKTTMEIHHDRHHQAYVDNLNKAIAGTDAENLSLLDIIKNVSKYSAAVRNNGGGHYNHSLFWKVLGPNAGGAPTGELAEAINATFGSFDELKKQLQAAGATRFGSGWAWLIVGADGKLAVTSTPNQDNPLMDVAEVKGTPILGIDVWEHAYYLKFQNKRPAYLEEIFNVINWDAVAQNYAAAK
ncbi:MULTISPECIES: superoxide dismutase [Sphingobacterium]|jgi:Fe-Mn family superoxide dismutase|uniref:Superoxide dismutase n=2 Tax=Sphingobacterium TaxID=28453 RepID=A0A420G7H3_9SPHI|nr:MULTISPECIES: superoxide dismutase [Sphingobacterium]MBB1642564.1 superoxide dismutase [Sphingobacterium sp. UME9]MCS4167376.1 Fe-Mn family superoxide dismutase [Sphingobacterium sp. BIGb0116]QMV69441.1 superoxide dismutase [Sphingobacterium paramultivorum]QRY57946.1 superoxide dismutase [Sphingobacterium siyangense]RKF41114.1 superoxide dismutase [Sphingobacterium siyangense]